MPKTDQKVALFVSKATLENCRCHGEMAKKKAARRAMFLFLKSSKAIRYVNRTARVPKNADGKRTAKSFKPKAAIDGTTRYV